MLLNALASFEKSTVASIVIVASSGFFSFSVFVDPLKCEHVIYSASMQKSSVKFILGTVDFAKLIMLFNLSELYK